jgi:cephalosporin hydroxylase
LTSAIEQFLRECNDEVKTQGNDNAFKDLTSKWFDLANSLKYSYHFTAFGRPIIQYPQDMIAVQELIWTVKPDLVIETGIAHGGSLILSAGTLAALDYADAVENGHLLDPRAPGRKVIGVDIDIRAHNRQAVEAHPFAHKVEMIQGSSIDRAIIDEVYRRAAEYTKILIFLDSNHTHNHVLAELEAYAPLTSRGSYCVIFDTVIEDMVNHDFSDRPWGVGNSPKTAVWSYLRGLEAQPCCAVDGGRLRLEVDRRIQDQIMVTVAPDGYLKRVE